jgi:hypothetical protein
MKIIKEFSYSVRPGKMILAILLFGVCDAFDEDNKCRIIAGPRAGLL